MLRSSSVKSSLTPLLKLTRLLSLRARNLNHSHLCPGRLLPLRLARHLQVWTDLGANFMNAPITVLLKTNGTVLSTSNA
jgi:hypothetical protein